MEDKEKNTNNFNNPKNSLGSDYSAANNSNKNYIDNDIRSKFFDLTSKAAVAENTGEELAAVNLYLAAYELVKNGSHDAVQNALVGVKKAWRIVLAQKNRPMAEAIFDIFSKHLTDDELNEYAGQLHDLMVGKLEKLGLSFSEINNAGNSDAVFGKMKDFLSELGIGDVKPGDNKNPIKDESSENLNKVLDSAKKSLKSNFENKQPNIGSASQKKQSDKDAYLVQKEISKYENLVGFENAISFMRNNGYVNNENSQYMELVERLNKEHGLSKVSFSETMIFKSPSRYDANLFMEATASELGLSCIQMRMDDNIQGASVLSLMSPTDSNLRLNPGRTGFNGTGIIMLHDVDAWELPEIPDSNSEDGISSFLSAQMSRGVSEITNLIDIALEDPNILVMASVGNEVTDNDIKKVLGADNFVVINVDNPTDIERAAIWSKLAKDHPSLRAFSIQKLVNYSKNMSRYDIEIAVQEALEDAYKMGIKKGEYIPLSIVNIIERLADHQPLDSTEYKTLEDLAIADFKKDLENIDDILN